MKHKKILITISVILVTAALALGVARSHLMRDRSSPRITAPAFLQPQNRPGNRAQRSRNLSLQPEAFNMGRRLGTRFSASRRETSVTMGTLLIGSEQRHVQTKRVQTDDGEQVEIRLLG